jgi:carboxylesterase
MTGVLCLHGLTGSPDELAPLDAALSSAGFLARTPLISGHGADVAALAHTTYHDWIRSADEALTALVAESGGPAAIVASSAGGLLAMHLAVTRPRDITRIALFATPTALSAVQVLKIRGALMLPAALRWPSIRVIKKPDGVNVADRTLAANLRSLPAYPIEALGQLLALMKMVRGEIPRVTQPVLIVRGALDAVVLQPQVDALARALTGAERVERLELPASAHLVAIDRDRDRLAADVIRFVGGPAAGSRSS